MAIHIIKDGKVVNSIVATLDEAKAVFPDAVLVETETAGVGWLWDGKTFTPPLPPPPSVEQLQEALTEHLDRTAQARNWDNRITCMVRAGFDGPFRAEAAAFSKWADTCNATAYKMLAEVQAGKRGMPKTVDEFLKEMPEMVWP